METSLAEAFIGTVGQTGASDRNALERQLVEYVTSARAVWPDIAIDERDFVRFVAARCSTQALPPLGHAADMLLACACLRGSPAAIRGFHREFGDVIDRVLSHRKAAAHLADDARQILEQKLLVGESGQQRPKLADYRGAGPLRSWVATSAARVLHTLRRAASRKREVPEAESHLELGAMLDPELEYLKQRYAAELDRAITDAIPQLSPRDRTLLRLHVAEQMTIDSIGALYTVNRATAARWLSSARKTLLVGARAQLSSRLQLSESQCDSLVALAQSRLNVSLLRHLAEPK